MALESSSTSGSYTLLCLLFCNSSGAYKGGSILHLRLDIAQFLTLSTLVSCGSDTHVLIMIYCKQKLLWQGLRKALLCEHNPGQ